MELAVPIALSGVAVIPFAASWRAQRLTPRVISGSHLRRWKAWCLTAALRWLVLAAPAVAWLVVAYTNGWLGLDSDVGTAVFVALAVGVIAAAVFETGKDLKQAYWSAVHDALEKALPKGSSQRREFNSSHKRLLEGDGQERRLVLDQIVSASNAPASAPEQGQPPTDQTVSDRPARDSPVPEEVESKPAPPTGRSQARPSKTTS